MKLCKQCKRPAFAFDGPLCAECRVAKKKPDPLVNRRTRTPRRPLNDEEKLVLTRLSDRKIRTSQELANLLDMGVHTAAKICTRLRRVGFIAACSSSDSRARWSITVAGLVVHNERRVAA